MAAEDHDRQRDRRRAPTRMAGGPGRVEPSSAGLLGHGDNGRLDLVRLDPRLSDQLCTRRHRSAIGGRSPGCDLPSTPVPIAAVPRSQSQRRSGQPSHGRCQHGQGRDRDLAQRHHPRRGPTRRRPHSDVDDRRSAHVLGPPGRPHVDLLRRQDPAPDQGRSQNGPNPAGPDHQPSDRQTTQRPCHPDLLATGSGESSLQRPPGGDVRCRRDLARRVGPLSASGRYLGFAESGRSDLDRRRQGLVRRPLARHPSRVLVLPLQPLRPHPEPVTTGLHLCQGLGQSRTAQRDFRPRFQSRGQPQRQGATGGAAGHRDHRSRVRIRRRRAGRRSTSASSFGQTKRSASSARPGPANQPFSPCCCGSTNRQKGRSSSAVGA